MRHIPRAPAVLKIEITNGNRGINRIMLESVEKLPSQTAVYGRADDHPTSVSLPAGPAGRETGKRTCKSCFSFLWFSISPHSLSTGKLNN